jgi:hypothetical protein
MRTRKFVSSPVSTFNMSMGEKDASDVLGELQGKGDFFTKMSVTERKRVADLEDAIAHISAETEKYRGLAKKAAIDVMNLHVLTPNPAYSRADGVDVAKQAQAVTTKVLTILEMKLNKLLQRQSEIIIQNKALKSEIDHQRRLRMQVNVSHAKFEALLAETKASIETRLSESAAIVEERERLVEEKERLELINREEQEVFQEEYEEMGRFIKKQNQALEDSLLKERKEDQQKKKKAAASEADAEPNPMISKLSVEEEVAIAKQMGDYTQFAESEKEFLSGIESKIERYNHMFEQLKDMTQTYSLDEVVSKYVEAEDEMFSMYNFVQTVNAEIDTVHESIVLLDAEVEEFKKEQEEQEASRKAVLDSLQNRMQATEETTQHLEEENHASHEAISQLSKKISSVFFKLQCDQMDAPKNKTDSVASQGAKGATVSKPASNVQRLVQQAGGGASDSNVTEFLACIEQRAVDIISEYLRMRAVGPDGANRPRSPTPGPASPSMFPLEPVIDFNELDDDDILAGEDGEPDHKLVDLNTFKEKLAMKTSLRK